MSKKKNNKEKEAWLGRRLGALLSSFKHVLLKTRKIVLGRSGVRVMAGDKEATGQGEEMFSYLSRTVLVASV